MKGARHTQRDSIELDVDGAVGDRVFALVDPARRRVLRTVEHPSLPGVRAQWDGTLLGLTLPSGRRTAGAPVGTGESLTCDYWGREVVLELQDGPHAPLLSDHLGFPVRLATAPRGGVVYGRGVSVVTTASLRSLAEALGHAGDTLDPARFRATVVVEVGETAFAEEEWAGRELRLGPVRVRVGAPIPRCAVVDLDPVTGGRDLAVLRTLGTLRPPGSPAALCFGVDADVTVPGTVGLGDVVSLA